MIESKSSVRVFELDQGDLIEAAAAYVRTKFRTLKDADVVAKIEIDNVELQEEEKLILTATFTSVVAPATVSTETRTDGEGQLLIDLNVVKPPTQAAAATTAAPPDDNVEGAGQETEDAPDGLLPNVDAPGPTPKRRPTATTRQQ